MQRHAADHRVPPRVLMVLGGAMVLLASTKDAQAQSSAHYQIARSVISSAGETATSPSFALTGTMGQPSPVEVSDSASYSLGSGFWGAMVRMFSVAIESISYSVAEGVRITWESFAGATYTVQFTENLTAAWQSLSQLVGTGGLMEWLDDGTETGSHPGIAGVLNRFYRLRGQP